MRHGLKRPGALSPALRGTLAAATLYLIASSGAGAQDAAPQQGTRLPAVVVEQPPASTQPPATTAAPKETTGVRRSQTGQRPPAAPAGAPASVEEAGASAGGEAGNAASARTPLNTNAVPSSTSLLGITVRETPATVEVIDRQTMATQGYRTVTEAAQGAVGVTSGDFPAEPAAFSMRGFTNSQINMLYNGIKIGPQNMTSRPMDAANLERIEFLKGPASMFSGEGAIGGAINFVSRQPHTGPIVNEAFAAWDSFNGYRTGLGSGGSTGIKGLDYRFDLTRTSNVGFVDDTITRISNVSGQLDWRLASNFKIFGAIEHREDSGRSYWGTPLVSASFSGSNAVRGIVSGSYVSNYNGTNLGPVTIDGRTLTTNYNVLDNRMRAEELWRRGGLEWAISSNLLLKSQVYVYSADREWFNNEVNAFNATSGLVDRERFFVAHRQNLVGNVTSLQWDTKLAGMDNRLVTAVGVSKLDFERPGAANFPSDQVSLVDPVRGVYGLLTVQKQTAQIQNTSLTVEDRLKLTPTVAVMGGVRTEKIELERTSVDVAGNTRTGFPFEKSWDPTTGRVGMTWEAIPGLTVFGQYATAADLAANNIFLLGPTQPLELTTSRTYETGIKQVLWDNRAEWSVSIFDILRKNVYAAQGGQSLALAGEVKTQGVELAAAVRPVKEMRLWGNIAYVDAYYDHFQFKSGTTVASFTGNAPPNVPGVVINGGASYRFATPWPVEMGVSVRHVGDRYNTDSNAVTMLAYTTADAYMLVDIPRSALSSFESTRLTFRVRNLTDERFAAWGDPFYPDQILLGAPRSFEVSAAVRF